MLTMSVENMDLDIWYEPNVLNDEEEPIHDDGDLQNSCKLLFLRMLDHLDEKEIEYIDLYRRNTNKPRIAGLLAHGSNTGKQWLFFDGEKWIRVQKWIKEREEEYSVIIICSCNPGSFTPVSKKSVLLIPDNVLSSFGLDLGIVHFSLIHPKEGELDYIIEYEISVLKNNLCGATI